ncbi:SNF1-RELATED PROTEIN KINASE 3.8, CBL-INTERACTING PROTEIN KINASE 10, SOS3-interacting protein 1 [Hibiscus trionum]|uniref:non-specific serine/threonine protein kinase n=1 Tax=Hibiscus trionum TaxID=183268 RepID=A0A9W7H8F7_HIBTR|nr:SNF1-RELATED PROTEIN KINASE 3.8, CBL-INTERACTING PROTEIN KINASE 10, SOS3-interacting protein 1 [Hibiscus trionum]
MENKRKVLMQKYEFGNLLGQGNFGKVYYAKSIGTKQSVAIKVIEKEMVRKVGMVDQTKTEISSMSLVKHPNILELYEVLASKNKIYYVMEYADGGELFNEVAKGKLREDMARKYFQQLISAVEFCHSRGVYHRDLKPENLLLDDNGTLKVSDFGLSALGVSKHQDGLLHTTCGTPAYVAPEVINQKGYDGAKADIWSCGVILFVLLAGYLPFRDSNLFEMYKKISTADYRFPSWFSPDVTKLLSKILNPNPKSRISIAKLKTNSWFKKGFKSKSLEKTSEQDLPRADTDVVFGSEANTAAFETMNPKDNLPKLNAFDIISLSSGLDLSGLFTETKEKKEVQFTSVHSASAITSKLKDIAQQLKFKIKTEVGGVLKIEKPSRGRKSALAIDMEIFELTPSFYLVEMKKSSGDSLEYKRMLQEDIRPALEDIVWSWQ